jgi:hypothetical protein
MGKVAFLPAFSKGIVSPSVDKVAENSYYLKSFWKSGRKQAYPEE